MNIMLHVCDSALLKMRESACHCPIIVEKAFNPDNSEIANKICGTIVILAIIAALTILLWKLIEFWSEANKAKRERENVLQDSKLEQIAKLQDKELEYKKDLNLPAADRKFTHTTIDEAKDPYLAAINRIIGELKK